MDYNQIVSQVVRRLGWDGFANELKYDLRHAITWAEDELMSFCKPSKKMHTITVTDTDDRYSVPPDFTVPTEVQAYQNGAQLAVEHVPFDQWMRWNPSTSVDSATENEVLESDFVPQNMAEDVRLSGKTVISFSYSDGQNFMWIKPAFDGTIVLNYIQRSPEDVFSALTWEPPIPKQFHHFIVAGAVHYMAQIESARAVRSNGQADQLKVAFYTGLAKASYAEFAQHKRVMKENLPQEPKPSTAIGDLWYEDPHKYTRGRTR